MDINKYIGSKIREYREKKNITQKELAEYLNTTVQSISRYEKGDRKTNQDILFSIADYFGVSINDFFPPTSGKKTEDELKELLRKKGLIDRNDYINEENFNKLKKIIDILEDKK